jgi:Domain of unknown function (DUF4440)
VEAEQSGEAGRVLAAARRRATALAERDAATLLKLLHPLLRWTTYRGDVLDRDQYVAGNTDGTLVWRDQRLDDVHIIVVGGTAVLVAVATDTIERDGQPRSSRLRLTQTWVRTEDGWRCLAGHAGPQM